jgi:hypothetical protein
LLHQVGDLFELNVKLRCQKVKAATTAALRSVFFSPQSITKHRLLFFDIFNETQNFLKAEHNLWVSLLLYMNFPLKDVMFWT